MFDKAGELLRATILRVVGTVLNLTLAISAIIGLWRVSVIAVLNQQEKLLSADMLYIPDLVQDVLFGPGRLSDWFFAPSPELFTEIPFYLPFALFGHRYRVRLFPMPLVKLSTRRCYAGYCCGFLSESVPVQR